MSRKTKKDWRDKINWKQAGLKAYYTKIKNTYDFTDEELEDFFEAKYYKQVESESRKNVREVIRYLGGVYDSDYESIPIWAKRKNGRALDLIVISLNDILPEYGIENANDVYSLLKRSGV
ncbi:hypothetical protein ES705_05505 [subsurface metagenome]